MAISGRGRTRLAWPLVLGLALAVLALAARQPARSAAAPPAAAAAPACSPAAPGDDVALNYTPVKAPAASADGIQALERPQAEATLPPGYFRTISGTVKKLDCAGAASIMYSPNPPQGGDPVYITVGIDASLENGDPTFHDELTVNGIKNTRSEIDQWDGCTTSIVYTYTCFGPTYSAYKTIPGADCGKTGGVNPWAIVIGGAVAVAAAAQAISRAAKARRQARGQPPKAPNETVGYILQLSQAEFTLDAPGSASLRATAYRVLAGGQYLPAPEAAITVAPPPASSGVTVSPATGMGDVVFTIARGLKVQGTQVEFTISAASGVSSSEPQKVTVKLGSPFVAWVNGKKTADVSYRPDRQAWVAPDIVCYFQDENGRPMRTSFRWGVPNPPAVFTPEGRLEVETSYVHDPATNAFTIKLRQRPGLNFATDPQLEQWLLSDGQVRVTVSVVDDKGAAHRDTVTLRFCPTLKMVAYSYDADIRVPGRPASPYEGLKLEPLEFIADGLDLLPLAVCFVRTDKETADGKTPLPVQDAVDIRSIEWTAGPFSDPEVDVAATRDGFSAYRVRSADIVRPTRDNIRQAYAIRVEPAIRPGRNFRFDTGNFTIPIKPQFPRFRFWVVPGRYRDTSDALAYVELLPSGKPLSGMTLRLAIDNPPGRPALQFNSCSSDAVTCTEDVKRSNQFAVLVKGSACWSLRYSGLSWKDLPGAAFRVTCEAPNGAVGPLWTSSVAIDVNRNISGLLSDLFDASERLQLTNPYFDGSSLPYHWRGALWNIANKFDSSKPYVCHWLRTHIMTWIASRRFYKGGGLAQIELMQRMNGIESEYCAVPFISNSTGLFFHVWANLFLAGTDHVGDGKALDPWWEQRWTDPALKNHEALITSYMELNTRLSERGLLAITITELTAGVVAAAVALVAISIAVGFPLAIPAATSLLITLLATTGPLYGSILWGPRCDVENYKADGEPAEYEPMWFVKFMEGVRKNVTDL